MSAKTQVATIDATPSKRIYLSIIADYGLKTAICELVDNAYDCWHKPGVGQDLCVQITIDVDQQKITISDNAGGVKEKDLAKLISPGASTAANNSETIGAFGVGSKRAVVALAQLIQISSRYHKEGSFRLEYDDEWLASPDWQIPYYKVAEIPPSTTTITLSNLRFNVKQEDVDALRDALSATYASIVEDGRVRIEINETPLEPKLYDDWAYPPDAEPKSFEKRIRISSTESVRFLVTGGLTLSGGSVGGDYGVFFYGNRRLICKAVRSAEVGFITGMAGVAHPRMSLARIIVEFFGPPSRLPWNSSKSDINYNNPIFQAVKRDIVEVVKAYVGLSKRLQEVYDEKVQPYNSGEIRCEKLATGETVTPSRVPAIPLAQPRFRESVVDLNKAIVARSPWARGLYEAIIAEDLVFRQRHLEQKNRICLILLDSTVEIALKDFLGNELAQPLGDAKLEQLFKNRISVHQEAMKHVLAGDRIWQKLEHYYKLRCELIHRRVNPSISDALVSDMRACVQKLLKAAFGLRFPKE